MMQGYCYKLRAELLMDGWMGVERYREGAMRRSATPYKGSDVLSQTVSLDV